MRILGLNIRKMDPLVSKNLNPGWYPIGNYPKPQRNGYVKLYENKEKKRKEINKKLYHLDGENTPDINVCCIAGRNGSGKSTLIDLMFRIINNISYRLIIDCDTTAIEWAYGVNADLHFETDNTLGYIYNKDNEVKFFWGVDEKGDPKELDLDGDLHDILHNLFYTICINYSIYSFHVKDYHPSIMEISKLAKRIDGKWLENMFHKNDGYLMPIVLAPFRDREGNIDMGRERQLAMQRLSTLILYFHLNGRQFITGYYPNELCWKFNDGYLRKAVDSLNSNRLGYTRKRLEHRIGEFYQRWEDYFERNKMPKVEIGENMRKVVLRYLAYKTLKICTIYSDYTTIYNRHEPKPKIKLDAVIKKIVEEKDHITVKIHQCLHYANVRNYPVKFSHSDVDELFEDYKGKVNSYDEMMELLPPSFFDTDLDMRKMKEQPAYRTAFGLGERFSLGSMSSGERQFLNSISYALYHIKNLEGVKDGNNRVHYSHINLILDEAELYYHPEYQRRYVKMLLETLSWCNFSRDKIRSINIIVVTHSPFILSDVVNDNVLYLENGEKRIQKKETFGANFYDMLYNSFFFEKNAIGEIASEVIKELMKNPKKMTDALCDILGDPLIRGYLINKAKRNV